MGVESTYRDHPYGSIFKTPQTEQVVVEEEQLQVLLYFQSINTILVELDLQKLHIQEQVQEQNINLLAQDIML